jgi:hypothetical protein
MAKTTAFTVFCCCFFNVLFAQQSTIKGTVVDTLNKTVLHRATIITVRQKDSVLHTFTRTNTDGSFSMAKHKAGKYLLLITYPAYADYQDEIVVPESGDVDLGKLILTLKSHLLEDVVVRQKIAAIKMKGDTIEYKADSFKVRAGASVEEMLKRLPGIQVDKNGNISAQGQKVEKVLVDGEEFFGDDPTVATQNIQANAIDKVQVFDRKSDQANFTGIDDGQRSKTLNLTLKEDKKKGYFGKLDVGGGTNDLWNNSAMINAFKAKRKISAYGIMSSTGKTGLDWNEQNSFGSSGNMNMEVTPDGGVMIFNSGDDFDGGSYWGQGLPKSWSGGVNYSNKYNGDKHQLNGSYRYGKINNEGIGNSFTQFILPDTLFFNRERRTNFSSKNRHSFNTNYEWQIDSLNSIKLIAAVSEGTQIGRSDFYSEALNDTGSLVNRSNRFTTSDGENKNLSASLLWRKKFKKIGRTFSLNLAMTQQENLSDGFLNSVNDFYGKTGALVTSDTINQKKITDNFGNNFSTKATYSEPIFKNTFVQVNYSLQSNNSESKRLALDRGLDGKYEVVNNQFSNDFEFDVLTHMAGATFSYNGKKTTVSIGNDFSNANFKQCNLLNDSTVTYVYNNLFPSANARHKINGSSSINFNYSGSTRQPTINQLQPVQDNTNPLLIYVGNPNLNQEFRHNFRLGYNSYKLLKQRGIWASTQFSTVSNAITNSNETDSLGRTIYKAVNVNGNYSASVYFDFNFKIMPIKLDAGFGYSNNLSRNNNFINKQYNTNINSSHSFNINFNKTKEESYGLYLRGSATYNRSTSSIRPDVITQFWTYNTNLNADFTLPWKINFNTDIEGNFRQKTSVFDQNNNVITWNASITKKILPKDKGLLRLSVNDLLNQNLGFNRFATSNMVKEDNYQTLRRYFLLSFIWNFAKGPAGAPSN